MSTNHTRARRVKGLIAGACGAALLLAGGTWALWYDEDDVNGGWVTAGNLQLAKAADATLYDISNITGVNDADHDFITDTTDDRYRLDQSDPDVNPGAIPDISAEYPCLPTGQLANQDSYKDTSAHVADVSGSETVKAWRASPGDTVLSIWPYNIALEGDNLVAELKIVPTLDDQGQFTGRDPAVLAAAFSEFKASVFVLTDDSSPGGKWMEEKLADSDPVWSGLYPPANFFAALTDPTGAAMNSLSIKLQAPNEGNGVNDPAIRVIRDTALPSAPLTAKTANACVVLKGTFDPETKLTTGAVAAGNLTQQELIVFPDLKVTLEQTRQRGVGNF
ncbi:MAG: SipW-dependent-type signal peptide-containing protein [Bifidobacteriaceae bacterium]|jgi:predicted ribosomally synthesized peptide with SipW-like signal peptide|nr:SipW-dependent-type signal peptide-containing protein [Bifidobacteriaceae bacterium]